MSILTSNNIQEHLLIEMKENSNAQLPSCKYDKKRLHKSEYVKAYFNNQSSSLTTSEEVEGSQNGSNTLISTTAINKKINSHRYTDGYFINTNLLIDPEIEGQNKKQFVKLSLVGLNGCGISPLQNKKTSILEGEVYKTFNTELTKAGYGSVVDYIVLVWNIFMNSFSNLMRYFGKIVGRLERKYSSGNVGYGMMAISTVFHLIPTLYVKCNPQIDFSLTLMARGAITMFLTFCMGVVKNQPLIRFCQNDMIILVVRGFLAALSHLYFFYAVNKLPLSVNYIIFNTGPIFVFVLSAIFFGVSIKIKEIIGIIISVSGVLCITNPDLINSLFSLTSNNQNTEVQELPDNKPSKFQYAEGTDRIIIIIIFVILYIGWAYGILIVKKVKEANTFAMNFYVALACFISGAVSFYTRDQQFSHLSLYDVAGLIFIVGLFSFGSQYTFITSTFLNKNHGPLSMLNYLSVIESYVVQMLFFNEVPSTTEISGSLLVLIGLGTILIKS